MVDRTEAGDRDRALLLNTERSHRFFIVHHSIGRLAHYPAFITLSDCTAGEWLTRGTVLDY